MDGNGRVMAGIREETGSTDGLNGMYFERRMALCTGDDEGCSRPDRRARRGLRSGARSGASPSKYADTPRTLVRYLSFPLPPPVPPSSPRRSFPSVSLSSFLCARPSADTQCCSLFPSSPNPLIFS